MLRRLIIFLIRKKLGLKKRECFRFTNQKTRDIYQFNDTHLMKLVPDENHYRCDLYSLRLKSPARIEKSSVGLNWLLDDECEIEVVE